MANSSFLKFGDMICLYSEQAEGYLSTIGNNNPNFIVQKTKEFSMATIPNQRSMIFQIQPKLNYTSQNGFNKILARLHKLQQSPEQDLQLMQLLKNEIKVQEPRRRVEIETNVTMVNFARGDPIMYGMNIQLLHVQSGQYVVMSTKSAEQDKTCQRLELSNSPAASRVTFQIQPRYRYRQEGDLVVYRDEILLYNVKNNAYMHFSQDLLLPPTPDESVQSEFRPKSPSRRRNPENLFQWFEANVNQNFQKWQIISYRQTDEPNTAEFELHGGDVVLLKHAESGGYITVDDESQQRNGLQEAYVRVYHGNNIQEDWTTNQLFELEQPLDELQNSGQVLSWVDEPLTGKQLCKVHLRHFNSGRLLQVTFFKDQSSIGQVVTLANSQGVEEDGANISGKKILTKGGKLQNFIFNLYSRSMVNDTIRTLSKDSVCNLGNAGTKLFLSTQLFGGDDDEEEDEEVIESEQERRQREYVQQIDLNQREKNKKTKHQMNQIQQIFEKEKDQHQLQLKAEKQETAGASEIVITKENQCFRKTKPSGDQDAITTNPIALKSKGSMNDVFLPIKISIDNLRDISFMQSVVPRIKLYLSYLRKKANDLLNLPFYISLIELMRGIVYWVLNTPTDVVDYQDPFKCDGFPDKFRQKVLRETRILDLLIDCLIYPFETGLVDYNDLTQQHPVTRICQLVYRILKHSVKENDINKNYVAQWIDLFFKQAMVTTEKNSFFAELTITELLTNNKQLLDTQIETTTIVSLIELCLNQPKHERFLNLLSHLCSCDGSAIASNQDDICATMLENEENRQGMLFTITTIQGIHYVNILDNGEANTGVIKMPIEELYAFFSEKKDMRLYNYFQSLINLMASICMERNYKCITRLVETYSLDLVIHCTLNEDIPMAMRARFARLLITLHMDKDPLERLNIPIMTRVWDEIESEVVELPKSTNIPPKLLALKPAFEKIIRETKGFLRVYQADFNVFLLEALKIIETMISLGFYSSEEEIISLLQHLIALLDGSLDFYEVLEEKALKEQLEHSRDHDEYQPLIKTKDQHNIRYKKTIENEGIVAIKNKIIQICQKIMDMQDNKRLSLFLISFQQFDKRMTAQQSRYLQLMMHVNQAVNPKKFERQLSQMSDTIKDTCLELNRWVISAFQEKNLDIGTISKQDFVSILLDLNLYENEGLVANAFQLLVRYFTQKMQILNLATEVQVLQDAEEIAVLEQCSEALRQMKKDAERAEFWMGGDQVDDLKEARSFVDRLSALTDLNVFRENRVIDLGNKKEKKKKRKNDVDEAAFQFLNLSEFYQQWDDEDKRILTDYDVFDEQNQRLLRNLRAYDISIQIIKQKSLKSAANQNAYLKVVEKAYIFLIKFVKNNKENQNIMLEQIEHFLDDVDLGVHALELISEIFRDSENLLTFELVPLIKKVASDIDLLDIETTKKATLLSFVPVFMFYKGQSLKDNQFLILNEFTSQARKNSNFLFVGPEGHEDLRIYMAEMKQQYFQFMSDDKLMAEIDVPPEVSYTINYIQLIAFATQGKNASCETRAQAVFPVMDVIINMQIADFCYPYKSALMFYLQNVYFDIEKEVTEDFTKVVWQVLDIVVEDMLKFTEVMQRQKRAAGGGGSQVARGGDAANQSQDETAQEFDNVFSTLNNLKVDANKNFTFVTAFGKFPVAELMQKYVFEGIFPSLEAFLNLRLPMKEHHQILVAKLLKLMFLAVPYKSKPIHDKNIQIFVRSIRSIPALQELGGDVNLSSLGISDGEETGQKIAKTVQISQAQKLKIFMKMTRSDQDMKVQIVKEFETLVFSIINIPKKTMAAFKGANTITVKEFINSLIKSTDITSDIPTTLKTQSLKIIRKVIESENKAVTSSAMEWENEDFRPYKVQITDAQNMLIKMDLVALLCRIISKETKREIREEAFLVCVAVLIGGNEDSQMKFHQYIAEDNENEFCKALYEQMAECFEKIKKSQIKRNVKSAKMISIDATIQELKEKHVEEDDEELIKLQDQRKSLEDELMETEFIADELRDGEEMTLSRSIENIIVMMRFIQLLCENHNLALQKMLCKQTNVEGRPKSKSVNIINYMAKIFEQMIKIINTVTVGLGHQLVDTIVECIQGPCKDNQRTLVSAKILDSCRELINMLIKPENLTPLGFVPNEEEPLPGIEQEDVMGVLDEFISKICTMLVALLEGETDFEIQQKMAFSLSVEDLKDRMLNVFGVFLSELKLFPLNKLQPGQTEENTQLSQISKECSSNCLSDVSLNKINFRLKKDSFEGTIEEAFNIFVLLQTLSDTIPSCAQIVQKESYTIDQWKAFDFIRQKMGMIEISVGGKLEKVYFPIRPICGFISVKTRKALIENVNRESQQTKVAGLMEETPLLIEEMKHNEALTSAPIQITPSLMAQLKDFSNFVGLFISLSQLLFLERHDNYTQPHSPDFIKLFTFVLGLIQGSSSFILIAFYAINKYALVTKDGWRQFVKGNKGKFKVPENDMRLTIKQMSIEHTHLILMCKGPQAEEFNMKKGEPDYGNLWTKLEINLFNVYFFLQDGLFQYYVLYFGISFLGFYSNELFYSFHLLDVIQRFPTLANVTRAITMNWQQLLMTFGLMLILSYVYATVQYFYIMETTYNFDINANDSDRVGQNTCQSMFQCYLTVVYIGFLSGGGIGDYTQQINFASQTELYGIKLVIDVSFFLILKIILYNILFGIIIDTFAQLREMKSFKEQDKNGKCFICNFERFTFDKESEGGFTRHISKDHNLWFYVYYIVHLMSKDTTDYTGIESYVSRCFKYQDIGWMPRQKALCLEKHSEHDEGDNEELDHFRKEITAKTATIGTFTERLAKVEAKIHATKKKAQENP